MTPTKLVVPALLCVVALGQITLARYSTLTPWTGGGFGAFASVDHPKNRFLSVVGLTRPVNRTPSTFPGRSSLNLTR